jgi:6-phosphogluconolactonase
MSPTPGKRVLVFPGKRELSEYIVERWAEMSEEAIDRRGRFIVALAGGRTPTKIYRRLAGALLPWDKIHLFLSDERFVPLDDPDSNYGMIKRNLLDHVSIPRGNVHPIRILRTLRLSAQCYEREIAELFHLRGDKWPRFDLVMLGIGRDGHTASLFPDHSALAERKRLAVAVHVSPPNLDRISLTLPIVNRARTIFFMVTGKKKSRIMKEIFEGTRRGLPASLVEPLHGELFFLLDRGAASLISRKRHRDCRYSLKGF